VPGFGDPSDSSTASRVLPWPAGGSGANALTVDFEDCRLRRLLRDFRFAPMAEVLGGR